MSFINSQNVCKVAQHQRIGSLFSHSPKTYLQERAHRCLIDQQNAGWGTCVQSLAVPVPSPPPVPSLPRHALRCTGINQTCSPSVRQAHLSGTGILFIPYYNRCEVLWLGHENSLSHSDTLWWKKELKAKVKLNKALKTQTKKLVYFSVTPGLERSRIRDFPWPQVCRCGCGLCWLLVKDLQLVHLTEEAGPPLWHKCALSLAYQSWQVIPSPVVNKLSKEATRLESEFVRVGFLDLQLLGSG